MYGVLCRHIFYILGFNDVLEFPKQYVLRRWTREAVPNVANPMVPLDGVQAADIDVDAVVRDIMFSTEYIVNKLVKDMDKLCLFRENIKKEMSEADNLPVVLPGPRPKDRMAIYAGSTQPSNTTIRVPIGTRFKGCGPGKRLKSAREQAISQSGKKQRKCSKCDAIDHDARIDIISSVLHPR
ncbi:hypothetical protein SSX86_003927 [Deinandra increscens subsp. villosa]|uniref:Protein FAR1-RELATED SEQUENCE n=1 Tax=Deinandra increscens subsp. villosa TaxID=3103831 RepID=A0AAP0H8B6_9ASTR